ncbi:MAG: hypothetical protein HeimC3_48060 [Candidatus Heimdallarchaeota archaeon LC_3]|nr:MAG: hypothetical protein HeimC3_48060 [Candidatus Heimdallarchaeota archaeon LC_3]
MKILDYPVFLRPEDSGGYSVSCPAFQGCYSQGDTFEDALKNIKEAIELCIEEILDEGEKLPEPVELIVKNVAVEYDA